METHIQKAADNYEVTVQKALPKDNAETAKKDALKAYLKTYGWVALGAWYQTFATANQRLADLADRAPAVTSMSSLGEAGDTDVFAAVIEAYKTQEQNSPFTPALGTITSKNENQAVSASDPKSIIMAAFPGASFANYIATEFTGTGTSSDQVNPLIKMKNIGDYTMGAAETIWVTYTTSRVIVAGGVKSLWGHLVDFTIGTGSAIEKGLDAISPVVHFLLFMMFTAGFTLSIYLPFIPFIFWMTGIGNWIASVLIGCTAGPLWGATHLGTSQDRGSRAAYGYIYLIDSMIRPSLMVFGFFFASVAIIAGGTILNALYGAVLVNVQSNSITGIFSIVGFLMIYARLCTTMVAALFALQAYLPDHVINFLGGRDGVNTMGSMASAIKDIFIAGNRNMRGTPGIQRQRSSKGSEDGNNKDGIKG
ncbi:DotA/TraY family protein [Salmonella enterica]|nr:DotA/TraY family protein [Salmonella enterica]